MASVSANLLLSNGEQYRIQMDDDAPYEEILADLVKRLELPVRHSPVEDYALILVDAVKIKDGAILVLKERNPFNGMNVKRRVVLLD